jgi:benzoate membrane transport protein
MRRSILDDVNAQNVSTGLTTVLWYLFGAVPLFFGIMATMAVPPDVVAGWFFITFFTSGVASMVMTLHFRQPIAIGWTMPGLVLISTAGPLGTRYSLGDLAGASIVTGVVVLAFGLLRMGDRLVRLLPLPIVLGMFAGSTLHLVSGVFAGLNAAPGIVGAALGGFVAALAVNRTWLPPVAGAVLIGAVAAVVLGQTHSTPVSWEAPELMLVRPSLDPGSIVALSLPLVVLVIGTGTVQGMGVMRGQGFQPPVSAITGVVGLASLVNALFGGHPGTVQNAGTAILAGEDAGPRDGRYVASLIAAIGCIAIAFGATTVAALSGVLPGTLVASLAGLAILRTVMGAFEKAVATELRLGAFIALAIAASPLTIFGIGPAFWAIAGGYVVSLVVERPALRAAIAVTPARATAGR